jgi:hypothetical protein
MACPLQELTYELPDVCVVVDYEYSGHGTFNSAATG